MKKFVLLFSLIMSAVVSTAQTISYLGESLSGNIETFTDKLALKGALQNKKISSKLEAGKRAFDITIFPYTCLGLVEYNPSTKNVFEGTLMFQISSTLDEFTNFMDNWSNQVYDKYSKGIYTLEYEEYEYKTWPAAHYTIYSTKNNLTIGNIYIYMDVKSYSKQSDAGNFMLHVMYRNNEAPSFEQQAQQYF